VTLGCFSAAKYLYAAFPAEPFSSDKAAHPAFLAITAMGTVHPNIIFNVTDFSACCSDIDIGIFVIVYNDTHCFAPACLAVFFLGRSIRLRAAVLSTVCPL